MTIVLAAIDADAAAVPTLQAAELMAGVYRAEVEVVHVASGGAERPSLPNAFTQVPVRVMEGEVVDVLADELARDDVVACAMGARADTAAGDRTGHVALGVLTRVDKPVALVPPEWDVPSASRLRILVPLDGTEEADLTVRAVLARVTDADVDVVVLHVFDPETAPPFLDRPEHDLPAWGHEFLQRHCDVNDATLTWRSGSSGEGVLDAVATEDIHAVILGWHGVLEPGRAAVVRAVLARAHVPVLLVPRGQAERTLAEAEAARPGAPTPPR
jgi:hypothetical protein